MRESLKSEPLKMKIYSLNYYECPHCVSTDPDEDERAASIYPCYHPASHSKSCPLDNKERAKTAVCQLLID